MGLKFPHLVKVPFLLDGFRFKNLKGPSHVFPDLGGLVEGKTARKLPCSALCVSSFLTRVCLAAKKGFGWTMFGRRIRFWVDDECKGI